MRIKFKEWNCKLAFDKYQNYRVCLRLVEEETGEPIATATVNLPDTKQEENEVFIKDYSENTGMLQALINAKVVTAPHRFVHTGYVSIPICKLMISPPQTAVNSGN